MKSYYKQLLVGILLILCLVAGFNWLVNPYELFFAPRINGFNQYKSEVGRHTRLSKAYKVVRLKPDTVLLASSRGMDVPEKYFTDAGSSGMNLSLASASTYELLRMLQHAQSISPLKKVILALDEEFTGSAQPNFSESRLWINAEGDENKGMLKTRIRDVFFSLLSFDALRSSLRTIKKQDEDPELMDYQKYKADRVYRAGGHRQMFRNLESSMLSGSIISSDGCQLQTVDARKRSAENDKYFKQIVELAYSNNIELYIYISPVHARFYEARCLLGKWMEMEDMKRTVVSMVEDIAVAYNRAAHQVWDFSGYNHVTVEGVPEHEDRTSIMTGYWEGSHYTLETAAAVFDVMFNRNGGAGAGFGKQLTNKNIEQHLRGIREQRGAYVASHNDDINELQNLLDSQVLKRNKLK